MTDSNLSPSDTLNDRKAPAASTMTESNAPASTKSPSSKYSLFDSTVLLLVSPDETRFTVHDTILCAHSAFFRTALSGPHTYLETDIQSLLQWLYTGNLSHLEPSADQWKQSPHVTAKKYYTRLLNLHLVADRLLIPRLKNDVITLLIAATKRSEDLPHDEIIEQNRSTDTTRRRATRSDGSWSTFTRVLADLVIVTMRLRWNKGKGSQPWVDKPEGYHESVEL
ncbi:MAG: hypothetical protein M1816_003653 [Peltula sp. TS41687]|nr:MAG: hypothetical protein M1816_003653 [Peltula sp. TS41687]